MNAVCGGVESRPRLADWVRWIAGTTLRRARAPVLAALLALLAVQSAAAPAASPRAALDAALGELAATQPGSAAESAAMEQAIAAARALPRPPATPDGVIDALGRAKAAARAATSPADFLDSAQAFGDAARQAPWIGAYHFDQGLMLEKAERFAEAALALQRYLKAVPDASDADAVRERIAGLKYLQEKAARAKAAPPPGPTAPSGIYYNDGDFNEASTTTLLGYATITAMRVAGGKISCGLFSPPNRNFRRPEGFQPYRDGEFGILGNTSATFASPLTFCDNARWCPTGGETGYKTALVVRLGSDGRSLRVRASNCIAKPDEQVLNWHPDAR